MQPPCVIVPNWNGEDSLKDCLDSLQAQTIKLHIIVVDNGSIDSSITLVEKHYPEVELIRHDVNKGYAGGVNPGFKRAIELGAQYAAPFNNDAVADAHWLEKLVDYLETHDQVGIATCKLLTSDGKRLDSTGDYYTVWGLPYPRGRGESDLHKYDDQNDIFAASGGASLYRITMLQQVGLFDEDFFAYYEDVDLSFRAQLMGWKVTFVPSAVAYHEISATSSKIKGFATYQTLKNLPLLLLKNVPRKYLFKVASRYLLAHTLFFARAVSRGQILIAIRGDVRGTLLLFTGLKKRQTIQNARTVSDAYIWQMFIHDLPPNARALRTLRRQWRKLLGKKA